MVEAYRNLIQNDWDVFAVKACGLGVAEAPSIPAKTKNHKQ